MNRNFIRSVFFGLTVLLVCEKARLADSFRQHEVVIHENITIVFQEIITWDKLFVLLSAAIEHNIGKPDHEVQLMISNVFLKPIFCPKKLNCSSQIDYNHTKDYDFQPELLVSTTFIFFSVSSFSEEFQNLFINFVFR